MIGISVFLFISRIFANATGLIAGPDRPPVIFFIFGFLVLMSKDVPTKVLIAETALPPFSLTTLAKSDIRETFGESLMMIGFFVTLLTFSVILPTALRSFPNSRPPSFTFGQETFISNALIASSPSQHMNTFNILFNRARCNIANQSCVNIASRMEFYLL